MVHQNKAPTACPAVGAFILVARSEDSNRATAPQCRNQQSCGLLVSPRESSRGMGKRAERAGGRDVAAIQPYGKRRALFFIAIIRDAAAVCAPSEDEKSCGGDRRLRRKQGAGAGAAVAEDKPRPKGRRPMRAPQLVRRHRSAGTNSPADCWLARGRVPGEWEREQNVPGVEMLPLYSLTENVRLFFIAIIREVELMHHRRTRTAAKATAACGANRERSQGPQRRIQCLQLFHICDIVKVVL